MAQDYFRVRVSGSVQLAVPLNQIETVLQIDRRLICPIPGVPSGLLGVVNRRGILTWVLDLSHFLELEPLSAPPNRKLAAISLIPADSDAVPDKQTSPKSVACIVEELEGIFTPPKIKPIRKRLKSRLRPILVDLAYYENSGIAILNPTALLHTLYTEANPI
ncbi:chemotaxis protein CheW [Oscillatoriales cyanobacterium LEGE 11467]|uniref:Chemotaxis protein CheW n=1 Tax=Zarconia navalis LEGE 11467 TaxID=1828826 RepID=A0A928Z6N9_9CYAN|nr:chemotaxis protein CheW [Zarconia navalis]MBE9040582.1 chemotaxis protein CheW [Zarconia navalis LEGE 11467]